MGSSDRIARERTEFTRRSFVRLGTVAWAAIPLAAADAASDLQLKAAVSRLVYLTPPEKAFILDKGKAGVTKFPEEELRKIGLTPDTWSLEVLADPAGGSVVERSFTRAQGNALDWSALMKVAEKRAIRFLHVTNCTNGADPYHMSHWEGVPLPEIVWMTGPKDSVRRVFYESYVPAGQPTFRSSLPMGMILETPPGDIPPVLAYKMDGELIPASRGGPVRMIVPGSYGSRSIKWLTRILLTNDFKANDSDGDLNNDPDNALKTRARFIDAPTGATAGQPFALTGLAQIGVSGLSKVQYAVRSQTQPWPADDPYRTRADWKDAEILPPPENWGGGLPAGRLPTGTIGIDPVKGAPLRWPMRYTIVHWAALVPGLPAGSYDIVCRTLDGNGIAQPMPRPLLRTGFNAIQVAALVVK
jgi:DMSO/TMAO reductase YedYZ molybdopterin-dependent catalytic subunit